MVVVVVEGVVRFGAGQCGRCGLAFGCSADVQEALLGWSDAGSVLSVHGVPDRDS